MGNRTYKAKRKNWRELPKEKWWVEGAIFEGKENSYIITNVKVTDEWEDSEIGADAIGYLVDAGTICQDTGMTDKDGNQIFEWDIVSCKQYIGGNQIDYHIEKGYVEMIHGAFGLHRIQGYYRPFKDWLEDYEYEVIGNVFDTPELMS